jgi:hypothetical protein
LLVPQEARKSPEIMQTAIILIMSIVFSGEDANVHLNDSDAMPLRVKKCIVFAIRYKTRRFEAAIVYNLEL